jgi:serine protease AprX
MRVKTMIHIKSLKRSGLLFVLLALLVTTAAPQKKDKFTIRLLDEIEDRGSAATFTAWIYFHDKGPAVPGSLDRARISLNQKSLERRLRHGFDSLIDEYDFAVYEPYVAEVKQSVMEIRHMSRWLNAVSVEATSAGLEEIAKLHFVQKVDKVLAFRYREPAPEILRKPEEIHPEAKAHVLDYGFSFDQNNQLNVPLLHDMGYSGKGILICMLDSGFNNLSHQALDHLDIKATWDFVNGDADVFDQGGQMGSGNHGTHTLSVIAGFEPGELIGPAYGASFLLGKTENSDWERHIEEDHWIAGAEWADSLGADIISSSLGYRDQFTHGDIDYLWQHLDGKSTIVAKGANVAASRGILIVNSAGNEGLSDTPENTLVSPSDSPRVLAAGAINAQGERVIFSSTGPTADGRIKPDVMARGSAVYSASPDDPDWYDLVDGTSFSCPLTAGVAALILEINPVWTNEDVMEALKLTASRSDSPDNHYGWGILDAYKAAFYPLKNFYAPREFAVKRLENNYGFFVQYVDQLSWAPNPRNWAAVKSYRIYAKKLGGLNHPFELIDEVDSQTFSLIRRGFLADETFLYKITSVSLTEEESDPDYARL